jgi:hypothetical protein
MESTEGPLLAPTWGLFYGYGREGLNVFDEFLKPQDGISVHREVDIAVAGRRSSGIARRPRPGKVVTKDLRPAWKST